MSSTTTPIGEILLRHEHLKPRELERLLAEPDRKQRLISMLILRAEIETDVATLALSEQTGYPGALERHLEQRDTTLAKKFPQPLMKTLGVVPLTRTVAGALVVIARDPSPALSNLLAVELAVPIELAVVPAIFIERLVQRLAGGAPAPGPPSLPKVNRPAPTRHRKSISAIMMAPLEAVPELLITSLDIPTVGRAPAPRPAPPPAPRATPPVIQIPTHDSGARPSPVREGSGLNTSPAAPRTISNNTIRRRDGSGSAPNARPSEPQWKLPPDEQQPRSRGLPPPPPPPEPPGPPGLTLDLDADEPPPATTTRPTQPLDEAARRRLMPQANERTEFSLGEAATKPSTSDRPTVQLEDAARPAPDEPVPPNRVVASSERPTRPTKPLVSGPPSRPSTEPPTPPPAPTRRPSGKTHPIPNETLQPLLDVSEPTPPPVQIDEIGEIGVIESKRPTRPAIIVPSKAIEQLTQNPAEPPPIAPPNTPASPPQRSMPNIIERPPLSHPSARQPQLIAIGPLGIEPPGAQVRTTSPKLQLHDATPAASLDDDWNDFEDHSVTAPPQPTEAPAPAPAQPSARAIPLPPKGLSVVSGIEQALSRATADRLLMKHAATRWSALLLVTITNDHARGARGLGPRLQAGVESIELSIDSSQLLQAACDPAAALPAGKDPLFDLLGGPNQPSSAPVVVGDRVVAVLAAGDGDGNADELRALASALAVAYGRFPAK